MAYAKFTKEGIDRANQTSISDIIRKNGEKLRRVGVDNEEWVYNGQKISIKGNMWFNHYEQRGGYAIKFVEEFMDKSFTESVEYLLGTSAGSFTQAPKLKEKKREPMKLPEKHWNMRRVNEYLTKERGINKYVVNEFAKRDLIYQSDVHANAVFVGRNKSNHPMHAHLRGTCSNFKCNQPNSVPEYSFHWYGRSNELYLFESPIDMLAYISMNLKGWKQHSYAACCGVGCRVMYQMLKDYPNIKKVNLCLDNDEAGQKANERIAERLTKEGIDHEILVPVQKDWDEDLLLFGESEKIERNEEEGQCQVLRL